MADGTPIDVAVAADDAFAMPMAVTIRSVLDGADPSVRFRFHVLDGGLSPRSRERLARSAEDPRAQLVWTQPNLEALGSLPVTGHVSAAAYVRLLLQHSLPEDLDRVIYLDSDLLVLDDLSKLWREPWEDFACLAVPDVGAPWLDADHATEAHGRCIDHLASRRPVPNYRQFGFRPGDPYLNSGVLVANLREWRRMDLCALALRCISDNREFVTYWDQYALNVVLHGRWRPLDLGWNVGLMAIQYRSWRRSPFDRDTYRRLRLDPRIVHFTTGDKPWKLDSMHPFRKRYFDTLDRTAWAGWRPGSGHERLMALLARGARGAMRRLGRR